MAITEKEVEVMCDAIGEVVKEHLAEIRAEFRRELEEVQRKVDTLEAAIAVEKMMAGD